MRASVVIAMLLLVLLGNTAFADQCEWVTKDQAERAAALFRAGPASFLEYCEPCGETAPTKNSPKPIAVDSNGRRSVEVRAVDDGYFSLFINGASVDLAYSFYKRGLADWKNVAKTVGCEATGVSSSVRIPDDGTPARTTPPKDPPRAIDLESELTSVLEHLDAARANSGADADLHYGRARRAIETALEELRRAQAKQ
jgi:hypothetical protein